MVEGEVGGVFPSELDGFSNQRCVGDGDAGDDLGWDCGGHNGGVN